MTVDFAIDKDGNFLRENKALRMTKSRVEYVAQKIQIKLRFFLGEWYLDTSLGIPYLTKILDKGIDTAFVESLFKAAIYEVTEIKELKSFSINFEASTRKLSVTFSARLTGSDNTETSTIEVTI